LKNGRPAAGVAAWAEESGVTAGPERGPVGVITRGRKSKVLTQQNPNRLRCSMQLMPLVKIAASQIAISNQYTKATKSRLTTPQSKCLKTITTETESVKNPYT
jgi:hypothetical protein